MALIVDTGALYAQADADEPQHLSVIRVLEAEREALITSQFVVAEADYLILKRLGLGVELEFLQDLDSMTYIAEGLTQSEISVAREVVERYRDLKLGIADASLVVLAQRHGTRRILTLDERAFRVIAPLQGGVFMVLPADG
jgi:uncharacterized protein